jgi:hypothetical protein
MSRILWPTVAENSTSASIPVDDESIRLRVDSWHAFISGTPGAAATVELQYSPDLPGVPDGNSIWYAPTLLQFTTTGDAFFWAKPRKFRVVVAGGDGSTNLSVEVRQ